MNGAHNGPRLLGAAALACAALCVSQAVRADAGPPYLTNDPGTPGNGNWEINIGSMQTLEHAVASYQLPQIDLNFGLGERIQLTYEIPYVLQTREGAPSASAWGNAYPGLKWRFYDEGEDIWPKKPSENSSRGLSAVMAAAVPQEGAGELDEPEVVGGLLVVADEQRAAAL